MEKHLNYNFMPTLKEMAITRIAVALCSEPDVLNFINEFKFTNKQLWIQKKFRCVRQIMLNLRLPESLKKQMMPIINAVADEILRWKLYHKEFFNGGIYSLVLKKLRWTTTGIVNYRETAEELVRCDVLDAVTRFQLSCFYCLEKNIPVFWKELSCEDKKAFYDGDISQIQEPHLQLFLPKILEKGESKLGFSASLCFSYNLPLNSYFERAAALGNKTLTDYYLKKLTETEREGSVVRAAKNVLRYRDIISPGMSAISFIQGRLLSEVACYLLSMMTAEEEIEIFMELPGEVLWCFVEWPYLDLFLDMVDKIWTFLPESKYEGLVEAIRGIFFPYPDIFRNCPVSFRKCFVDQECRDDGWFMSFVIDRLDTETIKILLRNVGSGNDPSTNGISNPARKNTT